MAKRKKVPVMTPLGGDDGAQKGDLEHEENEWERRLKAAKRFQRQYSSGWDENRRLIFNEMSEDRNTGGSQTPPWATHGANQVAYGWGLYEGLETSIYVQNPDVIASGLDSTMVPTAKRVTAIVDYDFDQMNVKDVGNLCLLDTFVCGYGAVIECVETYHQKDEEGKNTGQVNGQEFEIRRVAPADILFDPSARRLDLSDCKYLFTAWYPTVQQLKDDPNVTNLPKDVDDWPECNEYTRSHAKGEGTSERMAGGQNEGEKDPAFKTVCVWEGYDKVNHELLYLSDTPVSKIIGRAPWPVNLRYGCRDLFPHTLLYSHPVPGRFYPRPEAELIAPQLREINITERMISQDSRTKFRKWITISGLFSEDQKSKITDTSVANAMLFVDGTKLPELLGMSGNISIEQLDLSRLVVPIEDIAPKADLYTRYQMLEGEIQHIVGYGPAQRGGLPSTRSAREAMMINQKQDARLDKRKDRITDFYRLMAMKHIRFLQKYMSIDRYAKVLPKSGELGDWIKYGRLDVQGDFEFDVVAGSSVPKNTEVKRASELQLFQTVAPILMQSGMPVRPAFERLAEYYNWDNIDDLFANVKEKAKAVLAQMAQFSKAQVPPEQFLNTVAQLLQAELTPAEFQQMAQQLQGQGGAQQAPAGPTNMQRGDPNALKTSQGVP